MSKFKQFMGSAWSFTKDHGVVLLRIVAGAFLGRKVGRVSGQAADVLDKVIKETTKK